MTTPPTNDRRPLQLLFFDQLGGRVLFGLHEREDQFVAAYSECSPLALGWFNNRCCGFASLVFASQGGADPLKDLVDGGDGSGMLLAVG